MTDERVGVVGLGRMGTPILRHLVASRPGRVGAHDIDPSAEIRAVGSGAAWHPMSTDLARSVDIVVTALPGPGELRTVMTEMLPALRHGALWIDLTSGDPRLTAAIAVDAARAGIEVVSAPMGGSVEEATARSLTFYVGGDAHAVARATPVLDDLAGEEGIRHAGKRPQDGQIVKLLSNALWFAHAVAAGEALLLGTALGLRADRLGHLLRDGAGGSSFASHQLENLLDGDYLETFEISRVVEELDTIASLAHTTGTATRMLDVSAAVHRAASERYGPSLGELLGVRLLEDEANRRIRRGRPAEPSSTDTAGP